jgi:hypothetical protein
LRASTDTAGASGSGTADGGKDSGAGQQEENSYLSTLIESEQVSAHTQRTTNNEQRTTNNEQ